ncbi:hypothetical protein ABPG74_022760 [Tetrahymena malaccensis]
MNIKIVGLSILAATLIISSVVLIQNKQNLSAYPESPSHSFDCIGCGCASYIVDPNLSLIIFEKFEIWGTNSCSESHSIQLWEGAIFRGSTECMKPNTQFSFERLPYYDKYNATVIVKNC